MEPSIYFTEREVHVFGNVAVCWNVENVRHVTTTGQTKTVTTTTVRKGEPYIDFVHIRLDARTNEYYEDDDNIGRGGFGTKEAKQVALELLEAVQYLTKLKETK